MSFWQSCSTEKMTSRWNELGRALCRRWKSMGRRGGLLLTDTGSLESSANLSRCWILNVDHSSQNKNVKTVYICFRKSTGNCSSRTLAGLFFDKHSEERFMLWECWTNATRPQKFGKEQGKVASRTVALSRKCIHLFLCLWKQVMWNALLVFDKPVTWLAWRRAKLYASVPMASVAGSQLGSQLPFPRLDLPAAAHAITRRSHAASSPLPRVLLRPVNPAEIIES